MMVRVRTRDSRILERVGTSLEVFDPAKATFETAAKKFRECAEFSGICPPEKTEAILEAVREVRLAPRVGDFLSRNLVLT
jgi:hypothetical protein